MRGTVIVSFARGRDYELRITAGDKPLPSTKEGDLWLAQQFDELDCTPRSLVGKILILDKVIEVAREAGEKRFASDIAWAEQYARAVLAALGRDAVRVDLAENTVG
jgi:hypothetical protein